MTRATSLALVLTACLFQAQNPLSVSKPEKDNTVKGPNLSALEAGLPEDLLEESVLWSARQIKQGYTATMVITKNGRVLSGFAHNEDKTVLRALDLAIVQTAQIKQRIRGGTVMPSGLTTSLTRAEICDLIEYLSTLKTTGQRKLKEAMPHG